MKKLKAWSVIYKTIKEHEDKKEREQAHKIKDNMVKELRILMP
jgi:hypothetical protein